MTDEIRVMTTACFAMRTRFEIAAWGGSETNLRAAGEAAVEEIQRLEAQLSLYRPDSDVADLNARAADEPVIVEPRLFRLLERAARLSEEAGGAFDITVAPLMRTWGFLGGTGQLPHEEEIRAAREITGMHLVALDPDGFTVRFLRPGVMLDLGAIGKGYAIEQAADILREAGVGGALIHGGTSTVQAVGGQPDGSPWPVAIRNPDGDSPLAVIPLRDNALSVSAVYGKSFTQDDVRYGHVLDPRTGRAVQGALLSAVVCESAADSDALSTALLVLGEEFLPALSSRPATGALVAVPDESGELRVVSRNVPFMPV
jgi:thiamine biosynthesis lipoprotein